jgi:WD40 repeat protein
MVAIYPMVSFDADTQRYAVGSSEKSVVVYDLKTCTRLHTLVGHHTFITAVCFSDDGKTLASFAHEEKLVRFWSCGSTGLWFNSPPRCLRGLVVTDPLYCTYQLDKPLRVPH